MDIIIKMVDREVQDGRGEEDTAAGRQDERQEHPRVRHCSQGLYLCSKGEFNVLTDFHFVFLSKTQFSDTLPPTFIEISDKIEIVLL